MRYNLTPNQPCDMDATRRAFAGRDARWAGLEDIKVSVLSSGEKGQTIDVIARRNIQRKQEYPDRRPA